MKKNRKSARVVFLGTFIALAEFIDSTNYTARVNTNGGFYKVHKIYKKIQKKGDYGLFNLLSIS